MKNVIILGSGRSGTSMLAGCFDGIGYYLGDNYIDKRDANPKGFYEDSRVNQINEDIIKNYVLNIPEKYRRIFFPHFTFYNARWLARIPVRIRIKPLKKPDSHILELANQQPFCYKDPRFSYTLPVWLPNLPVNTIFLCVFREPLKTANSILKESNTAPYLKYLEIDTEKALSIWKSFYSHAIKNFMESTNKNNWKFIHYNQILDGSVINELNDFVGVKLNSDFPERKLKRSSSEQKIKIKYEKLYSKLCDLSGYKHF